MPPDFVKAADTSAWFEKARMDLRSARVDLAATPPIVGDALFHCQQAVEKVIKALLTWHDHPFRKTHDLADLGAQLAVLEPGLEDALKQAVPLTEYGNHRSTQFIEFWEAVCLGNNPIRQILIASRSRH